MESRHRIDPNAFIADIRTRYGANLPFLISRLSIQRTARDISRIAGECGGRRLHGGHHRDDFQNTD